MMNTINCGSYFHERIVLKNDDGEMLAYVPERTCKMIRIDELDMCECSNCQSVYDSWCGYDPWRDMYVFDYCQVCGAEVVDE